MTEPIQDEWDDWIEVRKLEYGQLPYRFWHFPTGEWWGYDPETGEILLHEVSGIESKEPEHQRAIAEMRRIVQGEWYCDFCGALAYLEPRRRGGESFRLDHYCATGFDLYREPFPESD